MEKPITVLIAEDDRDQREILTEVLECEGYRVLTASSPQQTVERLKASPDLVLLDVHGTCGPEVERALHTLGRRRPPVVIVSGDCRADETARNVCANECIAKPYDLGSLLHVVAKFARKKLQFSVLAGGLQAAS